MRLQLDWVGYIKALPCLQLLEFQCMGTNFHSLHCTRTLSAQTDYRQYSLPNDVLLSLSVTKLQFLTVAPSALPANIVAWHH